MCAGCFRILNQNEPHFRFPFREIFAQVVEHLFEDTAQYVTCHKSNVKIRCSIYSYILTRYAVNRATDTLPLYTVERWLLQDVSSFILLRLGSRFTADMCASVVEAPVFVAFVATFTHADTPNTHTRAATSHTDGIFFNCNETDRP